MGKKVNAFSILKKVIIGTLLITGVYVGYRFWSLQQENFKPIYLIPRDAVYILETDQPIANWTKLSSSAPWKHLRTNAYFAMLTEAANSLEKMIEENRSMFELFGSRAILVSCHMYRRNDFDHLFVVDLQQASRLGGWETLLKSAVGDGFSITSRPFKGHDIIELQDKQTNETLHLCFVKNLMIGSYRHRLVEAALEQMQEPVIGRSLYYLDVSQEVHGKGDCRFYFNYENLDKYSLAFLDKPNPYVTELSKMLKFSGLAIELDAGGNAFAKGLTNLNDSIDSYLKCLLQSGKGSLDIPQITPQRAAFYMGLGFDSFLKFYENLEQYGEQGMANYKEYQENLKKLEGFLDINIKNHFLSWIGEELAVIQTQPTGIGKANEFALIIKSKDRKAAEENLLFIQEKIRKKTPVKFKAVEYKGHQIYFLSVKGFFKALLGSFFEDLEKPYYVFIDRYVVFSNHPQTLKSIIDDVESGRTLGSLEDFQKVKSKLKESNNVFVYLQMPVLFENMKGFVSPQTWAEMQPNKQYIVCFSNIAIQLTKKGEMFDTRLQVWYKDYSEIQRIEAEQQNLLATRKRNWQESEVSLEENLSDTIGAVAQQFEDEIVEIENISPDDLDAKKYKEFHPNGMLKLEVSLKDGLKHGTAREYYETGEIKLKGKFKNDQRDGTWKLYDKDGRIIKKIKYKNGVEQS